MIYIALLRGINVGGNNKVEMAMLKKTFEQADFNNVSTYINSGNVIFKSDIDQNQISDIIEEAIFKDFKLNIPVVVRDIKNIETVNKAVPSEWVNDIKQKTDVMFLWDEVNKPGIVKQFKINPEFEKLLYIDGALVWNIDRKFIKKGEMIKIIGTSLYKQMTVRNINTIRKLANVMEKV